MPPKQSPQLLSSTSRFHPLRSPQGGVEFSRVLCDPSSGSLGAVYSRKFEDNSLPYTFLTYNNNKVSAAVIHISPYCETRVGWSNGSGESSVCGRVSAVLPRLQPMNSEVSGSVVLSQKSHGTESDTLVSTAVQARTTHFSHVLSMAFAVPRSSEHKFPTRAPGAAITGAINYDRDFGRVSSQLMGSCSLINFHQFISLGAGISSTEDLPRQQAEDLLSQCSSQSQLGADGAGYYSVRPLSERESVPFLTKIPRWNVSFLLSSSGASISAHATHDLHLNSRAHIDTFVAGSSTLSPGRTSVMVTAGGVVREDQGVVGLKVFAGTGGASLRLHAGEGPIEAAVSVGTGGPRVSLAFHV